MVFNYNCSECKQLGGGKKMVRKVTIKNNKGYKSVSKYYKGKHIKTNKKPLNYVEISMIKIGKFIPGLFGDCSCKKNKTNKIRS